MKGWRKGLRLVRPLMKVAWLSWDSICYTIAARMNASITFSIVKATTLIGQLRTAQEINKKFLNKLLCVLESFKQAVCRKTRKKFTPQYFSPNARMLIWIWRVTTTSIVTISYSSHFDVYVLESWQQEIVLNCRIEKRNISSLKSPEWYYKC